MEKKKNNKQEPNEPTYEELKSQLWLAKMQLKDLRDDYALFKKIRDEQESTMSRLKDIFKPLTNPEPSTNYDEIKAQSERILKPLGMGAQCARCRLFNDCDIRKCRIELKIKHCPIHSKIRIIKAMKGDVDAYLKKVLRPEETPASGVKIDIERPFLN